MLDNLALQQSELQEAAPFFTLLSALTGTSEAAIHDFKPPSTLTYKSYSSVNNFLESPDSTSKYSAAFLTGDISPNDVSDIYKNLTPDGYVFVFCLTSDEFGLWNHALRDSALLEFQEIIVSTLLL